MACGHLPSVTCSNCRPMIAPYVGYPYVEPPKTGYIPYPNNGTTLNWPSNITLETPKMTIEKVNNGFIIKYKGATYVFADDMDSKEFGNVIKNIFAGVGAP